MRLLFIIVLGLILIKCTSKMNFTPLDKIERCYRACVKESMAAGESINECRDICYITEAQW